MIRHSIIGPAHPGAFPALMACQRQLGAADRVLFPWELLAESEIIFAAALKATRKFLDLHESIENVHIFARHGFGQVAGRLADALYAYGQSVGVRVRIHFEMLDTNGEEPTATIVTCGDGREVFWRALPALHERYGTPRIFAVPGGEEWFTNNPEVAAVVEAWLHDKPRVPRVGVMHGGPHPEGGVYSGCGYRKVAHPALSSGHPDMEREIALTECTRDDTEYLWAPGYGSELLQPLRSRFA